MMHTESAAGRARVGTASPASIGAHPGNLAYRLTLAAGLMLSLLLASCADIRPYVPPSQGHITAPPVAPEPEKVIPPPARVTAFVPPPQPVVKPQTYSVVVNEVPVKELLLALARDTKQNIDIHAGLQGLVSLNAINETLPAILDRIAKQVDMRYRLEGNTIVVSRDTPYLKTYRINYVNMTRDTTSSIGVSGEISAAVTGTAGATGAAASGTAGGAASGSNTTVRTVSKNDFWDQLRENIRAILASTRARSLSAEEKAAFAEQQRSARESALKQAEAVARAGQGATTLFTTAFRGQTQQQPGDVRDDIIINPVSGTVSVLATERQHQIIQQHIDSIAASVQRQVLIEATIVEVTLSEGYQGGVDWSRLAVAGGITFAQGLVGGFADAAKLAGATAGNAIAIGYQNPSSSVGNISLTIKLLQEFGNVKVLSSPKLMALNNQAALLKVVDNEVYFETKSDTAQTQGVQSVTFTTTPRSVSVGVVMSVTPQISEDGRVLLTVRPTISRVSKTVQDPNPNLANPCGSTSPCPERGVTSTVPVVQTREMESVLQVGSGQTVILGGLMQDEVARNREQLPGADKLQAAGEAFRFRDERARKTELVIFLRPTVIRNPSLDSDELKFFQRFLPRPESPAEKTGPAP